MKPTQLVKRHFREVLTAEDGEDLGTFEARVRTMFDKLADEGWDLDDPAEVEDPITGRKSYLLTAEATICARCQNQGRRAR